MDLHFGSRGGQWFEWKRSIKRRNGQRVLVGEFGEQITLMPDEVERLREWLNKDHEAVAAGAETSNRINFGT